MPFFLSPLGGNVVKVVTCCRNDVCSAVFLLIRFKSNFQIKINELNATFEVETGKICRISTCSHNKQRSFTVMPLHWAFYAWLVPTVTQHSLGSWHITESDVAPKTFEGCALRFLKAGHICILDWIKCPIILPDIDLLESRNPSELIQ